MPLIPIDRVGSVGIIKDTDTDLLSPETWSSGNNIRFQGGVASKSTGFEQIYADTTVAPHWLLNWLSPSGNFWFYAGTTTVYRTDGTTQTNVTRYTTTPGDDDYSAGSRPLWTGGILHGVPILNNDSMADPPQQWDSATSRLKDLDNWPANTYCRTIRTFKNYLVALDITESGTRYPHKLMWGQPADPGTVPTAWTPAATNLAGSQPVSQTNGWLYDCLPLNNVNVLYKSDSIWGMQEIAGNDVFRVYEINSSVGLLAPRCVAAYPGGHFFVGQNDIFSFNGSVPVSIAEDKWRTFFIEDRNPTYFANTVVCPNYAKNEMIIAYISNDNLDATPYADRGLVWCWTTGTWSVIDLPKVAHINYGNLSAVSNTFDGSSGTFDTDNTPFGSPVINPAAYNLILAVPADNQLVKAESNYSDRGAAYTSYLERTGMTVDGVDQYGKPTTDPSSVKLLGAFIPKISAPTSMTLQISAGASETPKGPVLWEGPYDFVVGTDSYVNFTVSGKYLAIKIADNANIYPWTFSGYKLDLSILSKL